MGVFDLFDPYSEYRNEYDVSSFSAIKKPFLILKREMPLLLKNVFDSKHTFSSLLGDYRIDDMLTKIEKNSNYYSEIHKDPEKLKIWNDFQDTLHVLCRSIDIKRNSVYEAFMWMKQNDPEVGDIRGKGDIRFKALEILLNKLYVKTKIRSMASPNYKQYNYLTKKQLLELKEELQILDNHIQDIHNAIFNWKKKKYYLWRDKLPRFVSNNQHL